MSTDIPILGPDRIRQRHGSFGWIEHRFVRGGYLEGLRDPESLLYFFLSIVADQRGISFYSLDRIGQLLRSNGIRDALGFLFFPYSNNRVDSTLLDIKRPNFHL